MPSRRWKFLKNFKILSAVLAGGLWLSLAPFSNVSGSENRQAALVDQAITGDTVRLEGGKELRYISLESYSPESKLDLSREYGIQAQTFNQSLVGGKKVWIEWGPKIRDKHNRLLGYVFTEDGKFVNEEIVKAGLAKVRVLVPNTRYADELRKTEWAARRGKKGIWEKEPDDPHALKQVIGEKNTKIYYYPYSTELERIPEAQLVYFSSRVDARAAGYKPCFSCRQKGELDESQ